MKDYRTHYLHLCRDYDWPKTTPVTGECNYVRRKGDICDVRHRGLLNPFQAREA